MSVLKGKRILITGATGLIGSNLVNRLMTDGAFVIAMGRNRRKIETTFPEYLENENFSVLEYDVSKGFPVIENIDYIFHAAGSTGRDIIENQPVDIIRPNINGIINILEYIRNGHLNIRLVVFSSVTVYNNNTNSELRVDELQTTNTISIDAPNAPYAESKRMIEVIAKSYKIQYNMDIVIARFSTVYGRTHNVQNSAFYEFLRKAINGEDITLNGSGFRRRDNIYVDDAIEGLMAIVSKGISGESYNISCGGEMGNYVSVDELAVSIANAVSGITGMPPVKIYAKSDEAEKYGLILNNDKLKSLGWQMKYSLTEGLKETISYYLKHN